MTYYIDLDGTVANTAHREHYLKEQEVPNHMRWANFFNPTHVSKDSVMPRADVLNNLLAGKDPVTFLTSRPESTREASSAWLGSNFSNFNPELHKLLMKPPDTKVPSATWKTDQIAARGDKDFTFMDDDAGNRASMAERFPDARILAPDEGWDHISAELASQVPPTETEPSSDTPIETPSDSPPAEDYSDMDLTGGS